MKKIVLILLFLFFFLAPRVEAHPGRTDANGGHTCRTNCEKWGLSSGEYHYHNGGSAPIQTAPIESAPVQSAPAVQQPVTSAPTRVPTRVPTRIPTTVPTKAPYVETDLDRKKMFLVTRVVDGDTIDVSIRGSIERVRLLAIDTPETVDPRKPVQCFGKEATRKMQSAVMNRYVKLVDDRTQGNRDRYGRLLRYVYLQNGTFVNAEMVKQGYATSYKQYPTRYLEEFNKYEREAREKGLGLWSKC